MIAGSWGDRFDVAWGSGAITKSRIDGEALVTQPYYSTPANFFVAKDRRDRSQASSTARDRGLFRLHAELYLGHARAARRTSLAVKTQRS